MKVKVVGMKRWKGTLDGKSIDSAKVFIEVKLDGSRNGDREGTSSFSGGFCTEELKCPSDAIKRVEHTPLPFMAELETERVSNGRDVREVVIDIRPIETAVPKVARAA